MTDQQRTRPGPSAARRSERARIAVLQAADDLLVERGYDGVTVEGIAARAGVGKQTIYRWWSSKTEILLDTLREDSEEWFSTTTEPPRAALLDRLVRLDLFLREDPAGKVLIALIGQAQHDASIAETLRDEFLIPYRDRDLALVQTAVEAGEIPSDVDASVAIDSIYGALYYRSLILGDPLDGAALRRFFDAALPAA